LETEGRCSGVCNSDTPRDTRTTEQAENRFPGKDQLDNHGEALRHACWNALLTREYGEQFAAEFTVAHERRPGDNALREAMDLYDNEIGRRIAVHSDTDPTELARLVADAVRNGQTVVVGGEGRLAFSDSVPVGLTGDPADVAVPTGADPRSFEPAVTRTRTARSAPPDATARSDSRDTEVGNECAVLVNRDPEEFDVGGRVAVVAAAIRSGRVGP
jgi:hypothetical protein